MNYIEQLCDFLRGPGMETALTSWGFELLSELLLSIAVFFIGLLVGRARERKLRVGRNLDEYEFYPFTLDDKQHLQFDLDRFLSGVDYLLAHRDHVAAQQLILIGEQNQIRDVLDTDERRKYLKLYRKYDGAQMMDDTAEYLSNYVRIVNHIGESFKDLGIEVLLHDLSNPSRSLVTIVNNCTGRKIGDGATNLVLDLKQRKVRNEDKINYALDIGSRRFKCTTVPIYRKDYGLIGAMCINVDANYLLEEVAKNAELTDGFFREFCRTNQTLDENILSADEYHKAQEGKRHWRDARYLMGGPGGQASPSLQ